MLLCVSLVTGTFICGHCMASTESFRWMKTKGGSLVTETKVRVFLNLLLLLNGK